MQEADIPFCAQGNEIVIWFVALVLHNLLFKTL